VVSTSATRTEMAIARRFKRGRSFALRSSK
jgi:hypothetical protein